VYCGHAKSSLWAAPDVETGLGWLAMKLDGYVRVSRVGGRSGERFISPEVQRERIAAHVKANGHKLVRWHEDLDLPGTHSARPGLQEALTRVETRKVDGLIVAKLDRFGRSAIDVHRNLERIAAADGVLMTAAEGIDTSTPIGRFFLAIVAAFAELEIERIAENWQSARAKAVERGVHISGHTPVGYRRQEDGRLLDDPKTSWAVTNAFTMRAGGSSWKSIADWLSEEGIPTAHGAPMWTIATVRTLIRNRVYLGEARSGDLVKVAAHPPLVEEETWQAANRPRGTRHALTGSTAGMLSGIIRCAGCSFALKPTMGKTRHGKPRREYKCRPDKAAGRCPAPASVSAKPVEQAVTAAFFEAYGDLHAQYRTRTEERGEIERNLAANRAELAAALDERLVDALGGEDADAYVLTVRHRREAVERDEERLAAVEDDPDSLPDPTSLREDWENLTLQERRALIASAYSAVFLRRARSPREPAVDRLRFFGPGEAPPLPVRGQRGEIRSVAID
jgi:site-specific DNA recombinase